MMFSLKSSLKISLLTATSIVSSNLVFDLPTKAATFASSSSSSGAILNIDNFNIAPQNPSSDTFSQAVAVSGSDNAKATADATAYVRFEANSDSAFLNTAITSKASGSGNNYFGFGESSSFAVGDFFIDASQTLSFDFQVSLDASNKLDSLNGSSISTFSGVNFFVLDNSTDNVVGAFRAISNIDTNLAEGAGNDASFSQTSSNVILSDITSNASFGGNQEFAELSLQGSFTHTFNSATQVRLEVETLNRSCVQAPQTDDPCTRVPEPDNAIALILSFLGVGLLSRLQF